MKISLYNTKRELKHTSDLLLILGDGQSMRNDLETFLSWDIPHDVAALGRAIKEYPGKVRHWINADGECAKHWAENLPNGNGTIKHTLGPCDGFDVDWTLEQDSYRFDEITGESNQRIHGSSALFATLAALEMGYQKIILAGCPLDSEGHYYFRQGKDTLGPLWLGIDFMAWLDFAVEHIGDKVRSLSGYTAKILGIATREWLT